MECLVVRIYVILMISRLSFPYISKEIHILMKNEDAQLFAGLNDRLEVHRLALMLFIHLLLGEKVNIFSPEILARGAGCKCYTTENGFSTPKNTKKCKFFQNFRPLNSFRLLCVRTRLFEKTRISPSTGDQC